MPFLSDPSSKGAVGQILAQLGTVKKKQQVLVRK
jgi:hypothetical protein